MQQQTIFLEPDWDLDFGKSPQLEMRLVQITDNGVYVLGIAHSSIQIGDTFRRVQWFHPQQVPGKRNGVEVARLRLEVVSLMAFHNALNRAPAGMNVGVEFVGDAAPLYDALEEQGWVYHERQYHNWADQVIEMPKLMLVK